MLEIKTICYGNRNDHFDNLVNEALSSGWELTRRDVFIGPDHQPIFYAELERFVEEEDDEEEENGADAVGIWEITRNPARPFRCSLCGHTEEKPKPVCPKCVHVMMTEVD